MVSGGATSSLTTCGYERKSNMERRELYRLVEESAGDIAVKAKAHEEYKELVDVLRNLMETIETTGEVTPEQYFCFVDEMADAINVTGQIFKVWHVENDVEKRLKFKIDRLEQYLIDGVLCKDLDMSVVQCG